MSRAIFGVLIFSILAMSVVSVGAITQDEARTDLARAFLGVQRADRSFTYVGDLVDKLNTAARLIDTGGEDNITLASALISEVLVLTPSRETAGSQAQTLRLEIRGVLLVVLGVSALLVWFYGSRAYYGFWLRARSGWRVERV